MIDCLLFGHDWSPQGWNGLGESVEHFWECRKCGCRITTHESKESVKKRFDGYRTKYGDAIVETNEFGAPKPAEVS